jgi:hypothetical protein
MISYGEKLVVCVNLSYSLLYRVTQTERSVLAERIPNTITMTLGRMTLRRHNPRGRNFIVSDSSHRRGRGIPRLWSMMLSTYTAEEVSMERISVT